MVHIDILRNCQHPNLFILPLKFIFKIVISPNTVLSCQAHSAGCITRHSLHARAHTHAHICVYILKNIYKNSMYVYHVLVLPWSLSSLKCHLANMKHKTNEWIT